MIGKGRVIESDLFDIAKRVKEIDDGYFIVRDYRTGKFQLHHRGQRGSSLALILPFDRLDCRTLTYVRRTRAERKRQLLEEMERDNERLLKRAAYDTANKILSEADL